MAAVLPSTNNNDNTTTTPDASLSNPTLSPETPSMTDGQNTAQVNPTTPTDSTHTPRQQRVLRYLARRGMRNARITKRQTYADLMETRYNNHKDEASTPDRRDDPLSSSAEIEPAEMGRDVLSPAGMDENVLSPTELDGNALPLSELADPLQLPSEMDASLLSPWNAGLTRDILKSPNNQHQAPFFWPEEDERTSLAISAASTQPLNEKFIPSSPSVAPLAAPLALDPVAPRGIGPLLPPITYRPRSSEKAWRRKKVLRHIARKHMRAARATEYHTRRRLWTTISTVFMVFLLIFLSLGTAGSFAAYRFYFQTQKKYEHRILSLRDLLPLDNLKMYDSKGVPLMQMTDQGLHTTVTLDEIAPIALNATIATEDKNFWTNPGIDILRILRAALDDLHSGQVVEGGSTITQQLIKNLSRGQQDHLRAQARRGRVDPSNQQPVYQTRYPGNVS